ncbi:hypothetical protein M0R72_17300 [Candidatus Pacearchaeota archaeon]|jgi:hypothetical protein|nr:hypothetical protein [Candidatus Pacearchaeota archaeon]
MMIPNVEWHDDTIIAKAKAAMLDGGEEWARAEVMPAADERCPVDFGTLRDSHTVEREGTTITMGYGGPAAPYAERQHEDLTLSHVVGEAKWLENAFNDKLPELQKILDERLKGVL